MAPVPPITAEVMRVTRRWLFPLLLVLALAVSACDGGSGAADAGPGGGQEPLGTLTHGDPLPEATLPRLDGPGELSTSELVGRPSVINFWATWCAFCIDEMPDIETVHQELGDRVAFVGVDREDPDTEQARELADETGVSYPLVVDEDGSFFQAVRGRGMPTTLFVDADGVIRFRHAGPMDAAQLRGLIEQHLGISG